MNNINLSTPANIITEAKSHRKRKHKMFLQRRKRLRQTYRKAQKETPNKRVTVQELRVLEQRVRILEELVDELSERVIG